MNRASRFLSIIMAAVLLLAGSAVIMAQAQAPAKESETDLYTAWYNEKDTAKKVEIAKKYLDKFPKGQYAPYMKQNVVQFQFQQFAAAWQNHKSAELFTLAKDFLANPPEGLEPITFLYWPALESHRMTRARDYSLEADGRDFTLKAIAAIEAGKVPAMITDKAKWDGGEKDKVLGILYQNLGLLDVKNKQNDQAITEFQKAISLSPTEPYTAFQLGILFQDRYSQDLTKYNAIPDKDSPDAKAQLDVLHKDADDTIDALGRFMALTDGNPQWTGQRASVQNVLNDFWKERHPEDPTGSQKAVDKYKTPAPATPTPGL